MRSRLLRLFGVTLLLLAVSPATEPFATFDLSDLFGTPGTPATSSLQQQKVADEPVAIPGATAAARPVDSAHSERLHTRREAPLTSAGAPLQLRI